MYFNNNTPNNFGIPPICSVKDCKNFEEKKDGSIVKECCKILHNETLRPCKYYSKNNK